MKEPSIEEKAKRYDEALEKARQLCDYPTSKPFISDLQDLFTELKESEDERIRGNLIELFHDTVSNDEIFSDYGLDKTEVLAWLEKQGEQSPVDKVESKFHEGDWVIDKQGIVHQISNVIENVTNHTYGYDIVGGGYFNDNTEGVRLWTIKDAKDGDVLVYGDNPNHNHVEVIMIFKSVRNERSVFTHFHIFIDQFRINDWCNCGESIHPATKEQRDLLFAKMKEAGYEWNEETKELKKIEQTIEIPFGAKDSELQEATYHIPDGYHAEINGNEVIIKKGEQKTTWKPTEEQIEALEHLLETIRRHEYSYFHEEKFLALHSLLEQLKEL